jgi:hypothetical protein
MEDVYLQADTDSLIANNEQEVNSGQPISWETLDIEYNYALARQLPHVISLTFRDAFLLDGSKQNKAIHKVIDLQSRHLHDWRGPMVAYGAERVSGFTDPLYNRDLTPSDPRPIVHWFNTYYFQGLRTIEGTKQELSPVAGVRMDCLGDEKVDGRAKCEAVMISAYHWIFEVEVAPVSERLGFPIKVYRIPGSLAH